MSEKYKLSYTRRRAIDDFLKRAKELGLEVGEPIRIPMRDCDDVPKHIERMQKAHEETANSRLRFSYYYQNNN